MALKISLIIPVLNENNGRGSLENFLQPLQKFRGRQCEIVIIDGGSSDGTSEIAKPYCDTLLSSEPSRAKQMNHGAAHASGSILLFLHADTILPTDFSELITQQITQHASQHFAQQRQCWGRFNVRLSGNYFMFRIIEKMMNARSCLTGIATGDQAMFMTRDLFVSVGGFPDIALMEDVALSKKLKQHQSPICIRTPVITSSRRWEQYGIWRTIFLMWRLRLAFFLGENPSELKKKYL